MSFEEKVTWVNTMTTVTVVAIYAWVVGGQIADNAVADIAYQTPMLIAVGAIIALTIAGVIAIAIGTAIGTTITGEGSVDDIDRKDERDVQIGRRGDLVGYYVSSAFMVGALAVTMLDYAHFWIAHAIFAGLVVAGLISAVVKLVTYRRGY